MVIENLGAVTVICLDKTGTITENKMEVKSLYDFAGNRRIELTEDTILHDDQLLLYAAGQ